MSMTLVKTILVIRSSAMGDIVMASPLIKGLKRMYPETRILWLVEPQFAPLLHANPDVNGLLIFNKTKWKTLAKQGKLIALTREILALRSAMKEESIELALDVQGLFRSRFLAWLSGAKTRIGFLSKEPGCFFMTKVVPKGGDSSRMGSEYCHLLELLGNTSVECRPELLISADDVQIALEELAEAGVGQPFIAIAPFTTRPQKHWFNSRWQELASEVVRSLGMKLVILGGPADREHANEICSASMCEGVVNLAGQLSLMQSAAVIKHASLLIGVDTGLTHMGSAFSIPTIALFGATCPYTKTASPNTVVLYHTYPCSPCRRSPSCDGRFDCMQAISVAEVMQVATRLLSPEDRQ